MSVSPTAGSPWMLPHRVTSTEKGIFPGPGFPVTCSAVDGTEYFKTPSTKPLATFVTLSLVYPVTYTIQ